MKTVNFIEMKKGTKEEYKLLDKYEQNYIDGTADRILKFMKGLMNGMIGWIDMNLSKMRSSIILTLSL